MSVLPLSNLDKLLNKLESNHEEIREVIETTQSTIGTKWNDSKKDIDNILYSSKTKILQLLANESGVLKKLLVDSVYSEEETKEKTNPVNGDVPSKGSMSIRSSKVNSSAELSVIIKSPSIITEPHPQRSSNRRFASSTVTPFASSPSLSSSSASNPYTPVTNHRVRSSSLPTKSLVSSLSSLKKKNNDDHQWNRAVLLATRQLMLERLRPYAIEERILTMEDIPIIETLRQDINNINDQLQLLDNRDNYTGSTTVVMDKDEKNSKMEQQKDGNNNQNQYPYDGSLSSVKKRRNGGGGLLTRLINSPPSSSVTGSLASSFSVGSPVVRTTSVLSPQPKSIAESTASPITSDSDQLSALLLAHTPTHAHHYPLDSILRYSTLSSSSSSIRKQYPRETVSSPPSSQRVRFDPSSFTGISSPSLTSSTISPFVSSKVHSLLPVSTTDNNNNPRDVTQVVADYKAAAAAFDARLRTMGVNKLLDGIDSIDNLLDDNDDHEQDMENIPNDTLSVVHKTTNTDTDYSPSVPLSEEEDTPPNVIIINNNNNNIPTTSTSTTVPPIHRNIFDVILERSTTGLHTAVVTMDKPVSFIPPPIETLPSSDPILIDTHNNAKTSTVISSTVSLPSSMVSSPEKGNKEELTEERLRELLTMAGAEDALDISIGSLSTVHDEIINDNNGLSTKTDNQASVPNNPIIRTDVGEKMVTLSIVPSSLSVPNTESNVVPSTFENAKVITISLSPTKDKNNLDNGQDELESLSLSDSTSSDSLVLSPIPSPDATTLMNNNNGIITQNDDSEDKNNENWDRQQSTLGMEPVPAVGSKPENFNQKDGYEPPNISSLPPIATLPPLPPLSIISTNTDTVTSNHTSNTLSCTSGSIALYTSAVSSVPSAPSSPVRTLFFTREDENLPLSPDRPVTEPLVTSEENFNLPPLSSYPQPTLPQVTTTTPSRTMNQQSILSLSLLHELSPVLSIENNDDFTNLEDSPVRPFVNSVVGESTAATAGTETEENISKGMTHVQPALIHSRIPSPSFKKTGNTLLSKSTVRDHQQSVPVARRLFWESETASSPVKVSHNLFSNSPYTIDGNTNDPSNTVTTPLPLSASPYLTNILTEAAKMIPTRIPTPNGSTKNHNGITPPSHSIDSSTPTVSTGSSTGYRKYNNYSHGNLPNSSVPNTSLSTPITSFSSTTPGSDPRSVRTNNNNKSTSSSTGRTAIVKNFQQQHSQQHTVSRQLPFSPPATKGYSSYTINTTNNSNSITTTKEDITSPSSSLSKQPPGRKSSNHSNGKQQTGAVPLSISSFSSSDEPTTVTTSFPSPYRKLSFTEPSQNIFNSPSTITITPSNASPPVKSSSTPGRPPRSVLVSPERAAVISVTLRESEKAQKKVDARIRKQILLKSSERLKAQKTLSFAVQQSPNSPTAMGGNNPSPVNTYTQIL